MINLFLFSCLYNEWEAVKTYSDATHQEPMDARDSDYRMKKMELQHLEDILHDSITLDELVNHIDTKFVHFDLVYTELASHIVTTYGDVV